MKKKMPLRLKIASWLIGKDKFVKNIKLENLEKSFEIRNVSDCYFKNINVYYKKSVKSGLTLTNCNYNYFKKVRGFKSV